MQPRATSRTFRHLRYIGLVAPALVVTALLVGAAPATATTDAGRLAAASQSGQASAQRVSANRPTAKTTGVPAGTALRKHRGNLVITRPGTVIDRMDVEGFITVKAPNVRITRSIVRGGATTHAVGLITNYGSRNLLIRDTTLQPRTKSVYVDGIKGWNFTAERVHVIGGVDSIKVQGSNVRIRRSLLENTTWFAKDGYQNGGPTHNDNIQIQQGRNIVVEGNTIRGAQNFAVLGAAAIGDTSLLYVRDNWVDGGHCTVKLQTLKRYNLKVSISGNVFGPNRKVRSCPLVASSNAKVQQPAQNVFITGDRVPLMRWDG